MDWNNFMAMLGIMPQKQMPAQQLWPGEPMKPDQVPSTPLPQPQLRGLTPVSFLGTRG